MRRQLVRKYGRLGKFLVVGGTGVAVNTAILFLLHQVAGLPVVVASALAVEVAIVTNYLLNDRWTFDRRRPSLRRFVQFNVVSLGGLLLTTTAVWVLTTALGVHYLLANLVGIGLATSWNFAANVYWTWGADRRAARTSRTAPALAVAASTET
ncbi:MAG: GtrA family protein [Chloroflexi bacterium]|nr:GtrA family protein [Chloroflexota bacterium]MBV9895130.1 GtrA family protein [Chloroflexota bacterium]